MGGMGNQMGNQMGMGNQTGNKMGNQMGNQMMANPVGMQGNNIAQQGQWNAFQGGGGCGQQQQGATGFGCGCGGGFQQTPAASTGGYGMPQPDAGTNTDNLLNKCMEGVANMSCDQRTAANQAAAPKAGAPMNMMGQRR